jgi:hypothetical protein
MQGLKKRSRKEQRLMEQRLVDHSPREQRLVDRPREQRLVDHSPREQRLMEFPIFRGSW